VVDAEPVVIGVDRQVGEFGFQEDVLQPDIGARPVDCLQDGMCGVFRPVVAGIEQRGEDLPGDGRVPGLADVEGQQQPPPRSGLAQRPGVRVQVGGGLVRHGERCFALPGVI
jgi:hypothetical protein